MVINMYDVHYKIDIESESLTAMAKLLMGESLHEATKNLTFKQYQVLMDDVLKSIYQYDIVDIAKCISVHKQVDIETVKHILDTWPCNKQWPKLFGITKDYNVPETEYFNEHPHILKFYKEKFKLGLAFGICMWVAPSVISDDVEKDLNEMIRLSTIDDISHAWYMYVTNENSIVYTLVEMFHDNERFAQKIKLTNPDLADYLKERR